MFYFLAYLFLEVLVSVNISSQIGALATFFEIMASALLGVAILINFKNSFLENLSAVAQNLMNIEEFQRLNIFGFVGALLLILPGFLTDLLGISLQFSVVVSMIVNRYNVKSTQNMSDFSDVHNIKKDSDVIDVEIINSNTTLK